VYLPGSGLLLYSRAVALNRDLGDRYHEAESLTHIGDAQHAVDDHDSARHAWQQALRILDELDHPDAQTVRTKLRAPAFVG
jgi:predicted negative regulator of RcsB-dependent stress response